jgi:hypothetical protein
MPRTSRGRTWTGIAVLCLIASLSASLPAQQSEPAFRGIGFDERLTDRPLLAEALRSAKTLAGMPLSVRVIVDRPDIERSPGVSDFSELDARVQQYRAIEGIRVYLDLRDVPRSVDALTDWGRFVRAVATRYRGQVRGYVFGIRAAGATRPPAREDGFFIKTTAVNIRAGDAQAATIVGGIGDADADWLQSLYAEDIAPYVDAIGLDAGSTSTAVIAAVEKSDASSAIVLLGEPLGAVPDAGAQQFVTRQLSVIGSKIAGATYSGPQPVIAAALTPIATLRGMFEQEIVALDPGAAAPKLTRGGADVASEVQVRMVFGVGTLTNYVIYEGGTAPFEITLVEPTGTRPAVVDVLRGTRTAPRAFRYDAPKQTAVLELAAATRPQVVDWDTGQISGFVQRDEVASKALPTVAEIISRHQQAQTAQDASLRTYVTNASMDQHFRPNAVEGGFDVVTENKMFVEGTQTEWEELSFTLNGTRWGPNRPAFPLLQAEKVLSLPLDLRLDSDYRYSMAGVEDVEGRPAFALRFDPVDDEKSLYRGTVWIDRETYRKVKVQTVQTKLVSPILSSEEIQYFGEVGKLDGQPIHLMTRLVGRQIMLIAGRNLMVERGIKFDTFQLNPADFETQRAGARVGNNIMYRDTEQGLRYLAKKDGERVVQEATTSATAALVGVNYDPSYDYPLPLLGVNYLNFNFLGNKDTQAAVVFGGVLALVNVQRAKLLGERVDGSLDLFAIAVKGNDRAYNEVGEIETQRLNTRPFSTGFNLGWQVGQFQKFIGNYQFRYDAISSSDTTAASFTVPVSTVTNGIGGGFEWKQAGYAFFAGGMANYRAQWEEWGEPGDYRPEDKSYLKYSASLTKDFIFGFHKIHVNAAYYGGKRLDRFSAYQFGMFDENKVHGVPSSGVRFGELAMFRGSYAFNLFDQHRLEVFIDSAYGRDYRVPAEWRPITGIGIGGNTRGPFNTLIRGDFGKSFLPARYRGAGSIVLQIQVLKPL